MTESTDTFSSLPVHWLDKLPLEQDGLVQTWGWPKFRAKQIRQWVFGKGVDDPARMTDLSARDREELSRRMVVSTARTAAEQHSRDGTMKLLLAWDDPTGLAEAETVMIPDGDRRTACVSSQVGCPVGCRFCASGMAGLKQNLSAGRIVEQVHQLNHRLRPRGETITNLVFMGMGEPLANYAQVTRAIQILHDRGCFDLGWRRLTLSTVGVPVRMRQLADEGWPINLALSLHAPNEELRRQVIPWAEHFELADILDACAYYFAKTGREITFEYILLSGVNDEPIHANELAGVCRKLEAKVNVNLLRYNEVPGLPFTRPEADRVMRFQTLLRNHGVNAHVRKSRGRDIDAACGQLRRKQTLGEGQLVQIGAK